MELVHLVTSQDIKTWSKTKKNILLGAWCWNYLHKTDYYPYKFEIINEPTMHFWRPDQKEIVKNGRRLIKQLLLSSISNFNNIHNENYNERYWTIILKPWINNFVQLYLIINERLKIISNKYKISSATFLNFKKDFILPNQYGDGIGIISREGPFLNLIIQEIFQKFYSSNAEINFVDLKNEDKIDNNYKLRNYEKNTPRTILRNFILKIFDYLPILNNKPFIIGSGLPYYLDFLLKITNFQSPRHIKYKDIPKTKVYYSNRCSLIDNYLNQKIINFENNNLVEKLFFRLLPSCYIEGYIEVKKKLSTMDWPDNPKYIFSSVNHFYDEFFKFYAAEKTFNGVPYYLGQHGNKYCTHLFFWDLIESETADKFLVWGKKKNCANAIEAFNLRKPWRKKLNRKKLGGLLLVTQSAEKDSPLMSSEYDYQEKKFIELSNLYNVLNKDLKKNITVRLYHSRTNEYTCEEKRWIDLNKTINLELGYMPISRLIKKNRIVVFSYDSTGFLECLSQNIPVILFIGSNEINTILNYEIKQDYNLLKRVNILFTDYNELSFHLEKIWHNIDLWWASANTQRIVKDFTKKYCKTVNNPIKILNKILI